MCSTISPCARVLCFCFLQTKHFCKAPTSDSHNNLILGFLRTAKKRFGGSKCARLSSMAGGPLFQCPTSRHMCKALTSSPHQKFGLGFLLKRGLGSGGHKGARLAAFVQGPSVSVSCKRGIFVKPRLVDVTKS